MPAPFKSWRSTVTPSLPTAPVRDLRLLTDPNTGAPVGIQSQNSSGPDGVWTPIDVTADQIANPPAAMLADLNSTFRLNVAPYERYRSDGTGLVEEGSSVPNVSVDVGGGRISRLPKFGPLLSGWFGVSSSASASANAAALQRCLDESVATARPMVICGAADEYLFDTPLEMPSFSATGNPWDEGNPCVIMGEGWNRTKLHYVGSGGYGIYHPTIGGTTNRGQNFGVELSGFSLTGPQDFANAAHGIGIDNTRRPFIHRVRLAGFAGGNGIHVYGNAKGGTFYATIFNCYFGNQQYQTLNGHTCVDLDELKLWTMRYAIHLDGPATGSGKVNGTYIADNYISSLLVGAVKISGHGSFTDGGSAETRSVGNTYFFGGSRKLEEGDLAGTPTDTVMQLRQADVIYSSDGDLVDMYLQVTDADGVQHARYIDGFVGATREVTLASALPFVPAPGASYTLGFSDAAARADFAAAFCMQHAFYWDSTYALQSVGDRFEQARVLVASANATENVALMAADVEGQDGRYCLRVDGSEWGPRAAAGVRNIGSDQVPAPFIIRAAGLWDGLNPQAKNVGALGAAKNNVGARVNLGDVVELTSSGSLGPSTTGNNAHVVIQSLSRAFFENGTLATYAVSGKWEVSVDGATSLGDLLIPSSTPGANVATPISPASATTEQASRSIGKAISETAGAGLVIARIGAA